MSQGFEFLDGVRNAPVNSVDGFQPSSLNHSAPPAAGIRGGSADFVAVHEDVPNAIATEADRHPRKNATTRRKQSEPEKAEAAGGGPRDVLPATSRPRDGPNVVCPWCPCPQWLLQLKWLPVPHGLRVRSLPTPRDVEACMKVALIIAASARRLSHPPSQATLLGDLNACVAPFCAPGRAEWTGNHAVGVEPDSGHTISLSAADLSWMCDAQTVESLGCAPSSDTLTAVLEHPRRQSLVLVYDTPSGGAHCRLVFRPYTIRNKQRRGATMVLPILNATEDCDVHSQLGLISKGALLNRKQLNLGSVWYYAVYDSGNTGG